MSSGLWGVSDQTLGLTMHPLRQGARFQCLGGQVSNFYSDFPHTGALPDPCRCPVPIILALFPSRWRPCLPYKSPPNYARPNVQLACGVATKVSCCPSRGGKLLRLRAASAETPKASLTVWGVCPDQHKRFLACVDRCPV